MPVRRSAALAIKPAIPLWTAATVASLAKRYNGTGTCPEANTEEYGYDQGTYGVGQRTAMTNTQAIVTWEYDRRGRAVAETRTIAGMGTYTYRTAYIGAVEETVTPTALLVDTFDELSESWSTKDGGEWKLTDDYAYQQTDAKTGEAASVRLDEIYGDITATVRVRIEEGEDALVGLALRRDDDGDPAYFFGLRNEESSAHCGIYERDGSGWHNRTVGPTNCMVGREEWYTLRVRAVAGRLEMYVGGEFVAAWVDTTDSLPADGFGLMTFSAAATFDDVAVYGLSTRSYYAFGAARVAMRQTTHNHIASAGTVYGLHADHLGSTSLATTSTGVTVTNFVARYYPFGAERDAAASGLPTDFGYTGQRALEGLRLVAMGARWLDTALGRWASADTIVPDSANPQSLNRFSYVSNSPLKYTDPSGHCNNFPGSPNNTVADNMCWAAVDQLESDYGLTLENPDEAFWNIFTLYALIAVAMQYQGFIGKDAYDKYVRGQITIRLAVTGSYGWTSEDGHEIRFDPAVYKGADWLGQFLHTSIHELTQSLLYQGAFGKKEEVNERYAAVTGWVWTPPVTAQRCICPICWEETAKPGFWTPATDGPTDYARGIGGLAGTPDEPYEDMAESVAVLLYPASPANQYGLTPNRLEWIRQTFAALRTSPNGP